MEENKNLKRVFYILLFSNLLFNLLLLYKGVSNLFSHTVKHPSSTEYTDCKNNYIKEVDSWIKNVSSEAELSADSLVQYCYEYGVDIVLVLSQGMLESHYGTMGISKLTNQVWNVGAYDNYTFNKIHSSHKFENPNQSIKPYLNLLVNRYLVNKSPDDLYNNFVDIDNKRFASNPNYEKSLRIIREIILSETKIDSLQLEHKRLSLKTN